VVPKGGGARNIESGACKIYGNTQTELPTEEIICIITQLTEFIKNNSVSSKSGPDILRLGGVRM
jgi:hypothetical protein